MSAIRNWFGRQRRPKAEAGGRDAGVTPYLFILPFFLLFIPFGAGSVILAIGMKEVEDRSVSIRRLGETITRTISLQGVVEDLAAEAIPPDLRG